MGPSDRVSVHRCAEFWAATFTLWLHIIIYFGEVTLQLVSNLHFPRQYARCVKLERIPSAQKQTYERWSSASQDWPDLAKENQYSEDYQREHGNSIK